MTLGKCLFIGAHLDDIEISCGGTILSKLVKEASVLVLSNSEIKYKEKIIRNKLKAYEYFEKSKVYKIILTDSSKL